MLFLCNYIYKRVACPQLCKYASLCSALKLSLTIILEESFILIAFHNCSYFLVVVMTTIYAMTILALLRRARMDHSYNVMAPSHSFTGTVMNTNVKIPHARV